jgi:hypothetical protein
VIDAEDIAERGSAADQIILDGLSVNRPELRSPEISRPQCSLSASAILRQSSLVVRITSKSPTSSSLVTNGASLRTNPHLESRVHEKTRRALAHSVSEIVRADDGTDLDDRPVVTAGIG